MEGILEWVLEKVFKVDPEKLDKKKLLKWIGKLEKLIPKIEKALVKAKALLEKLKGELEKKN